MRVSGGSESQASVTVARSGSIGTFSRSTAPDFAPAVSDTCTRPEENDDFGEGAAHSTAFETAKGTLDPELAQVTDAWHSLPPAIREAILAMLRAAE